MLVLVFEVSIKLVNSLNLALLVLLSPSVVRLHSVKKEMLSVLEAFSDELEAFVDLVLLFLKAFDVLANLVDTDLKPIVLSILIVHR